MLRQPRNKTSTDKNGGKSLNNCRSGTGFGFGIETRQLEAQFALTGFTMGVTWCYHALFGLDEETIEPVSDVLEDCF